MLGVDPWSNLNPQRRNLLEIGEVAVRTLRPCETAERWREIGIAVEVLQTAAMEAAYTNRPIGKAYNHAWQMLAEHTPHLRDLEKSDRSTAMWLAKEWSTIDPWLHSLTPAKRLRLNHPASIRRHYIAAQRKPAEAPNGADKPQSDRARIAELERQLAEANRRNGEDGSLFNLERDTGTTIGQVIVAHVGEKKAESIITAIRAAVKERRARRTHAG